MTSKDVLRTKDKAMKNTRLTYQNPPKLLSDNGPCYIASWLKNLSSEYNIKHIHGKPLHPQTQGKIERYLRPRDVYMGYGEKIKRNQKTKSIDNRILENKMSNSQNK